MVTGQRAGFQIFSADGLRLSAAVDVIEPRMEVDETQSGFGFTPRNEILNGRAAQVRDPPRPLRFARTCDKNRSLWIESRLLFFV
jgi:hypothetical protein